MRADAAVFDKLGIRGALERAVELIGCQELPEDGQSASPRLVAVLRLLGRVRS